MAKAQKKIQTVPEPQNKLDGYFASQPLWDIAQKFDAIEHSISPDFIDQFRTYKYQVLGLVAENMDVVEHPEVQKAIARETSKVVNALSKESAAAISGNITAEIFGAANDNIRKISS